MFQNWSSDDFYLPDMFIQNDQSTTWVSIAEISCQWRRTDVDISLLFYLRQGAGICTEVVKCFVAFFQSGESGWIDSKIERKDNQF